MSVLGMSLTVAVVTYKRPAQLSRIAPLLLAQLDTVDGPGELLVVDNDPAGSARPVIAALAVAGAPVRYVSEPEPGISAARNRALDECADRHLIVFIDDDETPTATWLSALVGMYEQSRPAGVVGQVTSIFDGEPDPWIAAGGFFVRRQLVDGAVEPVAATNNLLLDLDQVRGIGLRFDPGFGLTGGSDYLFTSTLSAAGLRIVACGSALVHDHVPADRLTRDWVLRRQMRFGNTAARAALALSTTAPARVQVRAHNLSSGLARVLCGAARILLGVLTGSVRHRARGARTMMRGIGYLHGAVGGAYGEYARARAVTVDAGPAAAAEGTGVGHERAA